LRSSQGGFGLGLHSSFFDTFVLPLIIIGILAWIAIPAFDEYKIKSQVSSGLKDAEKAQSAIEKAHAAGNFADLAKRGWPTVGSDFLRAIVIGNDGRITLQYAESVGPPGGNEIQIVPVASGKPLDLSRDPARGLKWDWQCGGPAGKTTVPEKYRPKTCRP